MKKNFRIIVLFLIIFNLCIIFSSKYLEKKKTDVIENNKELDSKILNSNKAENIIENKEKDYYLSDIEFTNEIKDIMKNLDIKNYSINFIDTLEIDSIVESNIILEIYSEFKNIEDTISKIEENNKIIINSLEILNEEDKVKIIFNLKISSDFDYKYRAEKNLINNSPFEFISKNNDNIILENYIKKEIENNFKKKAKDNLDVNKIEEKPKVADKKELTNKVVEKEIIKKDNFIENIEIDDKTVASFINIDSINIDNKNKIYEKNIEKLDDIQYINFDIVSNIDNFDIDLEIIYMDNGKDKKINYKKSHDKDKVKNMFFDISSIKDIKSISIYYKLSEGNYKNYIVLNNIVIGKSDENEKQ